LRLHRAARPVRASRHFIFIKSRLRNKTAKLLYRPISRLRLSLPFGLHGLAAFHPINCRLPLRRFGILLPAQSNS
jgi:hypothetical protein